MTNEILLFLSIAVIFSLLIITFRLFGRYGLIAWVGIATVLAEIAVTKNVRLFGMTNALGNVLFASNFLATDIITEVYGEKYAKKAVYTGIWFVIVFLIATQLMLAFIPDETDISDAAMRQLFSITPRVCIASVTMFFLSNLADVKLYDFLRKKSGGKYMWLRNNLCTILCNCGENFLFALAAFVGIYSLPVIFSIALGGSIIETVIALCDTPFLYLARHIGVRHKIGLLAENAK